VASSQSTAAGARVEHTGTFSRELAPFALAGVAVAAVSATGGVTTAASAEQPAPAWGELGEVVMYSYAVCPFCNKVRAFLDLHKGECRNRPGFHYALKAEPLARETAPSKTDETIPSWHTP